MITFMNQISNLRSSSSTTAHIPSPQSSGRNITSATSIINNNTGTSSNSNSGNGSSNNYLKGPIHRAYSSSTSTNNNNNNNNNNGTNNGSSYFFSSPNNKKSLPNGKVPTNNTNSSSYFSTSITGIGIRKRLYSYNNYYYYYNGLPSTSISSLNNKPRSLIERYAVSSIIFLAIIWIVATIVTIGYHGYYYGKPFPGFIPENSTTNNNNNKSNNLIKNSTKIINDNQQQNQQNQNQRRDDYKVIPDMSSSKTVLLHPYESPLVIFTCHRAEYLRKTLQYIYDYLPSSQSNNNTVNGAFCTIGCPIIISQDGDDANVVAVINEYRTKFANIGGGGSNGGIPLYHIQHIVTIQDKSLYNPYQLLAIHYGWALHQIFDGELKLFEQQESIFTLPTTPQRVIILEEDIQIAVDFFDYFATLAPLLDNDPTILAISAFNDNGYNNGQVVDPYRVRRSDFFPGLGWMMNSAVWHNEFGKKWPKGYWDDWIREPKQRQNRHILHPEISRTYHFGSAGGASMNQFGSHLHSIQVNTIPVPWYQYQNIIHQQLQLQTYNNNYIQLIQSSQLVSTVAQAYRLVEKLNQSPPPYTNYRIEYTNQFHYQQLVHDIQPHILMDDEKAGIYRTAYKGIVETRIVVGNINNINNDLDNYNKIIIPPNEYNQYQEDLIKNHPILFIMPPLSEVIASLSSDNNNIPLSQ